MKQRIIIGVVLTFAVVAIWFRWDVSSLPQSNGSHDGRYHTCGYVTEDGVTDHLDAYKARCGVFVDGGK